LSIFIFPLKCFCFLFFFIVGSLGIHFGIYYSLFLILCFVVGGEMSLLVFSCHEIYSLVWWAWKLVFLCTRIVRV